MSLKGGGAEFMWKWSQDVPVKGVTLLVSGAARPSFPQCSVRARVWVSIYDGIFVTGTHAKTPRGAASGPCDPEIGWVTPNMCKAGG